MYSSSGIKNNLLTAPPPKKQQFKQANFNWVHTVAIFISKCKRNQNYIKKKHRILRWFLNKMFSFLFIFGNPRILIGWVFKNFFVAVWSINRHHVITKCGGLQCHCMDASKIRKHKQHPSFESELNLNANCLN